MSSFGGFVGNDSISPDSDELCCCAFVDRSYWICSRSSFCCLEPVLNPLVGLILTFFSRLWRGQHVEELVLWHDQGYGDAIQNLAWIEAVSQRVDRLRLFVRASLMRVVQERMSLPDNCQVEVMNPQCPPWQLGSAHLGLWFAPLMLGGWGPDQSSLQRCSLSRSRDAVNQAQSPRIGLVWMAGRHQAPQPELAARLRDLPFD